MGFKKNLIYIGIIFICELAAFFSGAWWISQRRAVADTDRNIEIRRTIENLATAGFGIGESISRSLDTVELLEAIEREAIRERAEERSAEAARIDELEKGFIEGQGIIDDLAKTLGGSPESLGSLAERIGKAATKAEEYEELMYRLGISSTY